MTYLPSSSPSFTTRRPKRCPPSLRSIRLFIRWVVFPSLTFILVFLHLASHSLVEQEASLSRGGLSHHHHVYYGGDHLQQQHHHHTFSAEAAAKRLREAFQERRRKRKGILDIKNPAGGGAAAAATDLHKMRKMKANLPLMVPLETRKGGEGRGKRPEEQERRLSLATLRNTRDILSRNHNYNHQQQIRLQLKDDRETRRRGREGRGGRRKQQGSQDNNNEDDDDFLQPPKSNTQTNNKRTYPNSKIFFFVHIHKSAGSIMCSVAHHSGWNVNHERNCNVQDDQKCCGYEDTMEAQIQYAVSSKYDMVAAEMPLYSNLDYEHYNYLVVLRNSKQRYFSHWKHILRENSNKGPPTQVNLEKMEFLRQRQQEQHQHYLDRRKMFQNLEQKLQQRQQLEKENATTTATTTTTITEDGSGGNRNSNKDPPSATSMVHNNDTKSSSSSSQFDHEEEDEDSSHDYTEHLEQQQQQQQHLNLIRITANNNGYHNATTTKGGGRNKINYNNPTKHLYRDRDRRYNKNRNHRGHGRFGGGRRHPPKIMMHPSQELPNNTYANLNPWLLQRAFGKPLVGTNFSEWWTQQPDNWNFRQLCGPKCKGVPKYHLTVDHWIYVLQRLSKFHTILFQETLQDSLNALGERLSKEGQAATTVKAEDEKQVEEERWFLQSNLTQVQAMVSAEEQAKRTKRKKRSNKHRNRDDNDDEYRKRKKRLQQQQQQQQRKLLELPQDDLNKEEPVVVYNGVVVRGGDKGTPSAISPPNTTSSSNTATTTTASATTRKASTKKKKYGSFAQRLAQRTAVIHGEGRRGSLAGPPPGPEQLIDWDERMSALDDALYEIAFQWEKQKQQQQTGSKESEVVIVVDGWDKLLTPSKREILDRYFDDVIKGSRNHCTNECCATMCSAW